MKKITIETENVGGLMGKSSFSFTEGMNVVRAPNAIGKTSLLHAIELLGLSNAELKDKKFYANLFTGDKISVRTSGSVKTNRTFTVTKNDLVSNGDEPIIHTSKGRLSPICFATPNNPLFNVITTGKSLRPNIENLSSADDYTKVIKELEKCYTYTNNAIQKAQPKIAQIELWERQIKDAETKIKNYQQELKKLPAIDKKKLFENIKEAEKKQSIDQQTAKNITKIKMKIDDLKQSIKEKEDEVAMYTELIKKDETEKLEKIYNKKNEELRKIKNELRNYQRKLSIEHEMQKLIEKNIENVAKYKHSNCFACGHEIEKTALGKLKAGSAQRIADLEKAIKKHEFEVDKKEEEEQEADYAWTASAAAENMKTKLLNSINGLKSTLNKQEKKLKDEQTKRNSNKQNMSKLATNKEEFKKYEQRNDLNNKIQELKMQLESMRKHHTKDLESVGNVPEMKKRQETISALIDHMSKRKEQLVEEVRNKFNSLINQVYNDLDYKDIKDVTIGKDFFIKVTKYKEGFKDLADFPLEALSTSERLTLGLILLIVTKRHYLPEFPFFVIDEVVTSYDPSRVEKIKDYLLDVADYIIITQLKSSGTTVEVIQE